MLRNLPELAFVPVSDLLIHERHDFQRTLPLIERIQASGVFRNPPIVTPLQDGTGRYMVLDGANRTTALRTMEFPHALVQVVQPDAPGLSLQNWNHVVWEADPDQFLKNIRDLEEIELVKEWESQDAEPQIERDCNLATVKDCNGASFRVCTDEKELDVRVKLLNAIVDTYRSTARLDRTSTRSVERFIGVYPQFCGLVIFPQLEVRDVMKLAGKGYLLPGGITRFTVSPRALHLNYPLEELSSQKPLEEKNAALQEWFQERLAEKGVRYYAEETMLFDE